MSKNLVRSLTSHRIIGMPNQVKDHLLKLDTITRYLRQVAPDLLSQNHPVSVQSIRTECNYFAHRHIQVNILSGDRLTAEEGVQSRKHIGRPVAIREAFDAPYCERCRYWVDRQREHAGKRRRL